MKRFKQILWPSLASLAIVVVMLFNSGSAQLAVRLIAPDGKTYDVTGRNMPRGDDALVLYDEAFGKSTRTNAFGVEVVAIPATKKVPDGLAYEVTQVASVWECQKPGSQQVCGNAEIPANGVVLSATGVKRDLLKTFKTGDMLVLQEEWFSRKQATINVVDPSPENNPGGSGFPGYRASNQLLIYDAGYGKPSTGTNEFGFEVTVRNGIVIDQEGSDSAIPPDGYVLSGHGKGRNWLISNTPVGAKIEYDPISRLITSTVDFDTYAYQFDRRWDESPCIDASFSNKLDAICAELRKSRDQANKLNQDGRTSLAAATMSEALERLNRKAWLSYAPFPNTTIRGAWHRPVEKNRLAIGQTLDSLKASGLNSVFLETLFHGYTIFPSQTYTNYGFDNQNPKFKGEDLLQLWVEEAHKRNMQVHVWFQTFYGGTKAFMPPGPILSNHPEWANVQYAALIPEKPDKTTPVVATPLPLPNLSGPKNPTKPEPPPKPKLISPTQPVPSNLELGGYFLDPANPAVRDFLVKLATEIVTRYDVDGFQLDYIRYPASFPPDRFSYLKTTWGYTPVARNSFKSRYGVDPTEIDPKDPRADELWKAWNDFKTEQVTSFVERITRTIREKNPKVKISAAIFPDAVAALTVKHQDWQTWGRNGWIDFFAPMTLTSAFKVVEKDTRYMVTATNGKVPVYSGLFGPFNDNSAEHILKQIDTAKQAGASGYVLFDTAHLSARTLEALKTVQNPPPVVSAPSTNTSPPPVPAQTGKPAKVKKKHWWGKK